MTNNILSVSELRQIFQNKSDCYIEYGRSIGSGVIVDDTSQAMTEDRFIEVVTELLKETKK